MKHSIGHLNCHNNLKALSVAFGWRCDSTSLNEVGKIARRVQAHKQTHSFAVPGAETARRTSLSTQVVFQKNLKTTAGFGILAAEASTPDRIAPGRWLYGVGFENNFMHMGFHNHAVVDGRRPSVDRVAEHIDGLEMLMDQWRFYENQGYNIVLTSDLNERDKAESPGWRDAGERFRKIGLEYENKHLDWIVWNPERITMRKVDFVRVPSTDHPGIRAVAETR